MADPTYVPTELTAVASEELQTEIDNDMLVPDPDDKDSAIAKLINEDTE